MHPCTPCMMCLMQDTSGDLVQQWRRWGAWGTSQQKHSHADGSVQPVQAEAQADASGSAEGSKGPAAATGHSVTSNKAGLAASPLMSTHVTSGNSTGQTVWPLPVQHMASKMAQEQVTGQSVPPPEPFRSAWQAAGSMRSLPAQRQLSSGSCEGGNSDVCSMNTVTEERAQNSSSHADGASAAPASAASSSDVPVTAVSAAASAHKNEQAAPASDLLQDPARPDAAIPIAEQGAELISALCQLSSAQELPGLLAAHPHAGREQLVFAFSLCWSLLVYCVWVLCLK